jgi:phytoene dehydrogenase-like protein
MTAYDTIILGSSPNALTAAAYLAKAGQRMIVLESSAHIGGASATAQFAEGFQADIGLMNGRLNAGIARDLQLDKHGLEIIERNDITSLLPDQRSFTLNADRAAAVDAIGGFAAKDAERYQGFMKLLDMASDLLQNAYAITPPPAHHPSDGEAAQLMMLVDKLRGYGRREMTEVIRLLVMPARDLLDEWFDNPALKGLLGSASVRALMQGPFAGGATFNLLHHLAIGDGYFRATAKGGIGAISRALSAAAQSHGAELRANVGAMRVMIKDGVAIGAQLSNGETIAAGRVISDYDARYTFTQMIAPPDLTPEFNRAVKQIHYNGAVARVNLALRELPDFSSLSLSDAALRGTLVIAPSLAQLERAFDRAKFGELSDQPYLEATIPSLADASLAPPGHHVMSIWLQYAPYRANIDAEQVKEIALTRLSDFAPNLRALVLQAQVMTPRDYQEQFHLTEGHLYGGEMSLMQTFFLRPLPGYAQYRAPIENLYLCGAATHPGGGISGLAGKNIVGELIK